MMKTEAVPTEVKIATYYVVPIIPFQNDSTQNVLYFEKLPNNKKWTRVDPKRLNARGQNCNADHILVYQPTPDMVQANTDLGLDVLDLNVDLYAGVARTLGDGDNLPSMFPIGSDKTLIIPVTPKTTRGLILVFTKSELPAGGNVRNVTQLIASPDPEIKNSTGGA